MTEIKQWMMEYAPVIKEKSNQQPANSSVTIEKWMNRFKLAMCEARMDQHGERLIMEEFLKLIQSLLHFRYRWWNKNRGSEVRASRANPILCPAKLSGRSVLPSHSSHKIGMYFANQS